MSENVVAKLSLPKTSHPKPYTLSFLKYKNSILVSVHVNAPIFIGGCYTDLIWCDVVPMDAYHLLLGRPWKFDRWVAHDNFLITYSFLLNDSTHPISRQLNQT